jgi:hypothetical protein
MDIGSIFLILAILVPVVLYIGRPLWEPKATPSNQAGQDLSSMLAERDQIIASIHELDDDYQLGKIPPEVYPAHRLSMLQKGADILRQIDTQQKSASSSSAEDRLEAAVVARRLAVEGVQPTFKKNGNAVPPVPDDELEQKIALRRRLQQGKAGGFCPKCGKPVQATDRFCPKCGATLA